MPFLCGVDEVGRGALAGPMMAVAAMFEVSDINLWDLKYTPVEGVKDSKKFPSHKARLEVFQRILRCTTLSDFGLGEVSVEEIDKMGIEDANRWAFHRAIKGLKHDPNYVLVDGDKPIMGFSISQQRNAPKADDRWWPVAAASILAKVIRDRLMIELSSQYPLYSWHTNMGYGSQVHRDGLKQIGSTIHHRRKFIEGML